MAKKYYLEFVSSSLNPIRETKVATMREYWDVVSKVVSSHITSVMTRPAMQLPQENSNCKRVHLTFKVATQFPVSKSKSRTLTDYFDYKGQIVGLKLRGMNVGVEASVPVKG